MTDERSAQAAPRPPSSPERTSSNVPRLAVRKPEAAAMLGVSDETFDRHVRPHLPRVTLGRFDVFPVAALETFIAERAVAPTAELARRLGGER